ncbi:MAG: hypothetical protein M0R46_01515 [Candidatus Muirbacterium halophilum]|nr:hypothetical protein [Candidatus Muirbacterium halophilum]MCK9474573.1 hypothetical protein [Candidatus Muirbacterium halophilum]
MKRLLLSFILIMFLMSLNCFADSVFITGNNRAKLGEKTGESGLFSMYSLLKEEDNLWIDIGNAIESNKYTFKDNGKDFWNLYSKMGLDVLAVCNHEIDFGVENLNKFASGIDILSCNTNIGKPYVIKEFMGKKIGIIGVTRKDLSILVHGDILKEVKIFDLKKSVQNSINELKGKVDFQIILLSDFLNRKDFSDDLLDFFGSVKGVDFIFAFSTKEYEKLQFLERTFKNNTKFYVLPWGYSHIYRGNLKDNQLNFVIEKLPGPDMKIYNFFMNNSKYKVEYNVENPSKYVTYLFSSLRKTTNVEFVVLNPGTFNTEKDDLFDVIRYDGPLHIVRVKGSNIKKFVYHKDYYIYGVEPDNKVFGRVIEDNLFYNVLVNDFTFSQKNNIKISMIMKEKNKINSLRNYAVKHFNDTTSEKIFFKNMRNSRSQVTASFFKNDSYGAKQLYTGVSKLSSREKEENRIYFRNDLDIYCQKKPYK